MAEKAISDMLKNLKPRRKAASPVYGYLIIELADGRAYAYYESPEHHAAVEPGRSQSSMRIAKNDLANECELAAHGDSVYIVQELYRDEQFI
jgi:hypothetical protein